MSINITERTSNGGVYRVSLPDAEKIPIPAIRKAAEDCQRSHAALKDARRARDASDVAVMNAKNHLETEAASSMIETGKVPKGLRKAVKAAEEAQADAAVEALAAYVAFEHFHGTLVAVIDANEAAWYAVALKDAERSLNLITAARKSLEKADIEAANAYGVLGMLTHNRTNISAPLIRQAPQSIFVSQALPLLTDAIGVTYTKLEEYKRG